ALLNDKDKLPGPSARPSYRAKPGWRPRSASSAGSLASCARIFDFLDVSSQLFNRQLCIKLLNQSFGKRLVSVNGLYRRDIHAALVVVFGPCFVRFWLTVEDRKQGLGAIWVGTTREFNATSLPRHIGVTSLYAERRILHAEGGLFQFCCEYRRHA